MHRLQPQFSEIPAEPPPSVISIAGKTDLVYADEAPSALAMGKVSTLMPEMTAIGERYPLLRNAM